MPGFENSYLFEVSWEVCNKVGGIHTVIRSKLHEAQASFGERYFLLGPALASNAEFEETDESCWRAIREALAVKGIECRFGRWKVDGSPKAILVTPPSRYNKDQLLYRLWEQFGVDSIAGAWDYVEPILFSTACGEVIETVAGAVEKDEGTRAIAHFHEWMSGAGLLYLRTHAPEIATVFTTHATILGRSMMGGGRRIYEELDEISPLEEAKNFNVMSKHSMESTSARQADCFTTVSEITCREARKLLGTQAAVITENGIDVEHIPDLSKNRALALASREKVVAMAERFLGYELPESAKLVMISGRYEFVNKGLDVFLESLSKLRSGLEPPQCVLAFLFVLGGHLEHKPEPGVGGGTSQRSVCTHRLPDENNDPILSSCLRLGHNNDPANPVKVIFVPVYLSEGDGVLNMSYYDVLQAFDLGVFPSNYEPWGYTPLESVAYAVPTVTTDQAGFGIWVREQFQATEDKGVFMVPRTGRKREEIVDNLTDLLRDFISLPEAELALHRVEARRIGEHASWRDFYGKYLDAYAIALAMAETRVQRDEAMRAVRGGHAIAPTQSVQPHFRPFVVEAQIPRSIARLRELAYNLWWSWHPPARALFERIDPHLYEETGHNPVRLLDEVHPARLEELASRESFLHQFDEVIAAFDAYMNDARWEEGLQKTKALSWSHPVAYFSTEFGIHESIPIYSGGLGVLSGDHLKSASDLNIPLVGVGLFYKHGYFRQSIDKNGNQLARYVENDQAVLPLALLQDSEGKPVTVEVELPGRTLFARIWKMNVGRVTLYLMDTDISRNTQQDCLITSRLYVGDERTRIEQEILLGVGGARLLRRLNIDPSVCHLNEGHSAFLILENIRHAMFSKKMSFDEARECVRSHTVFTTHTPVEAGNERFPRDLMQHYFAHYLKEVGIPAERFFELGRLDVGGGQPFMMTILALKNAMAANGVSELHGRVSRRMWQKVWNGQHRSMVPIGHITNGVHAPTFIAPEMQELLGTYLSMTLDTGDLMNAGKWARLSEVPDAMLWDTKLAMKTRLTLFLRDYMTKRWPIVGAKTDKPRDEVTSNVRTTWLTIGFARRFAPYKRADLIFSDLDRLAEIVNNPRRPVQIVFAGKAHPNDQLGQELVKKVVNICQDDRFVGRIIFVEGYNLRVAKLLVQGVDVWLNTPRRPHEASGTSGQKAALNGSVNLSVADGWWCEAADETNGWTIGAAANAADEDSESSDAEDAEHLYDLIENTIAPLYYRRNNDGLPTDWLGVVRRSMQTVAPEYNTHRMLTDYYNKLYRPCAERGANLSADDCSTVRSLADWKRKVATRFSSVQIIDIAATGISTGTMQVGEELTVAVRINIGEMTPEELSLDLVVGRLDGARQLRDPARVQLVPGPAEDKVVAFRGHYVATERGSYSYGIRVMPFHPDLANNEETGLVLWA